MNAEGWTEEQWRGALYAVIYVGIRSRVKYVFGDNDDAKPQCCRKLTGNRKYHD